MLTNIATVALPCDMNPLRPVMRRTAGGERLFGDLEKEALGRLMWRLARFSGLEILTYAVMENHFHILARVPSRDRFVLRFTGEGGEERLLEHLRLLYAKKYIAALRAELADLRKRGMPGEADALIAAYLRRFCKGKLSRLALLRCRVRYFSDGLVLGSKAFVEGVFAQHRGHFGPARKTGARSLREAAQGSLFTAGQLAVRAVE
jgi:hypothetical protein